MRMNTPWFNLSSGHVGGRLDNLHMSVSALLPTFYRLALFSLLRVEGWPRWGLTISPTVMTPFDDILVLDAK